ncbi:hypothetical protein HN747_01240 [archaeon]|jgi:hypothetical protein|nr:hypothetical protein [archaeon]
MANNFPNLKGATVPCVLLAGLFYTSSSLIYSSLNPLEWKAVSEQRSIRKEERSIVKRQEEEKIKRDMDDHVQAANNLYELACRYDGITNGYSHSDMCWLAEKVGYEKKIEGQDIFRINASRFVTDKGPKFKANIEGKARSHQVLDSQRCFGLAETLDQN